MKILLSFGVLLVIGVGPLLGQDGSLVRWQKGNEYSDIIFYRGFGYKTIQFTNLFVGVAAPPKQPFLGYTALNLMLIYKGEARRMDIMPEGFTCTCTGGKLQVLNYQIPRQATPEQLGSFVQANSLSPGDDLKGILTFRGRCKNGGFLVRIPIGTVTLEFPFE